jgi:hypothetical protein
MRATLDPIEAGERAHVIVPSVADRRQLAKRRAGGRRLRRRSGPAARARGAQGSLPNLHGVVVARHGKLVLERYLEGADECWGRSLGTVTFGPDVQHDLRSVSKSIVGLLYGIALADGLVPAIDRPLVDHFPYPDLAADPQRRRMTIGHALSMTLGIAWDETLPYSDPRNSEIAMEMARDRYRFVLEQPIVCARQPLGLLRRYDRPAGPSGGAGHGDTAARLCP